MQVTMHVGDTNCNLFNLQDDIAEYGIDDGDIEEVGNDEHH